MAAFKIRLPVSGTVSMASSFHVSDVSAEIGANMNVEVVAVHFVYLSSAARLQRRQREYTCFEMGFGERVRNSYVSGQRFPTRQWN